MIETIAALSLFEDITEESVRNELKHLKLKSSPRAFAELINALSENSLKNKIKILNKTTRMS